MSVDPLRFEHRKAAESYQMELESLVEMLRLRAGERPGKPACTFLGDDGREVEEISYRDLDRRARAIAARLQAAGLRGERALLLYPPGLDFIVGFFGCLYAGVIAVPAYPPRPRRTPTAILSLIEDAEPRAVMTTASMLPRLRPLLEHALPGALWLDTGGVDPDEADGWQGCGARPEDLAFLQYTSGSTSAPRGVRVTHANLFHNERLIREAFAQTEDSVVVGWLPLYHDMGLIGSVLQPLYVGGRTILMSPAAFLQRPVRWLEAISRYRATTSGGPDFGYELCHRKVDPREIEGLDLTSWKVAFSGAEPVRHETLRRFAATFAPAGFRFEAFFPCYGLAEATLFVAGHRVGEPPVSLRVDAAALSHDRVEQGTDEPGSRWLVSCGWSRGGQRIAIVEPESGRMRGEDRVGEVWVAGESVAAGYWNRPEETGRSFGARLAETGDGPYLRTGDLGFLHAGELYVTGRLKDLIILRGRNHYPQDIERTAARSHPALRSGGGAAFGVESGDEERLVVVHEIERHREAEAGEVAEAIRRAVADEHEVPVEDVVLLRAGTIPKTSSGKIRRTACREGYLAGRLEAVGTFARAERVTPEAVDRLSRASLLSMPGEEAEHLLAGFLAAQAERFARVPPGSLQPGEPLSRLGLDSLAAAEWKQALEVELGVSLPLPILLDAEGVADLAAEVLRRLREPSPDPGPPLAPLGATCGEHPMSYGQQALWYLHRVSPDSSGYHVTVAGRVAGGLDAGALRQALDLLVDRHPALRTTFHETADGSVQRVHERLEPGLLVQDATGWSDGELHRLLRAEAERRFDLELGPPLRLAVFARPGETVLLLTLHHIVCDLRSLEVMASDLGAFWRAAREGGNASLPPAELRYSDFARWQRELLAGEEGERLWSYWREELRDLPVLDLPTDRPRPRRALAPGGVLELRLPPELAAGLRALGNRCGATLFMTLLTAFEIELARYCGQEDFPVGSLSMGRSRAGLTDVVGYFVNPVVLRAEVAGGASCAEVLVRARRAALHAFEHQDFPFALLTERLRPQRDADRPPLFRVMFLLQRGDGAQDGVGSFALGSAGGTVDLGGLPVESLALPPREALFDLNLMVAELAGGLVASLRFDADLFDATTAERWLRHFAIVLEQMAAAPAQPVRDLQLLSAAERHELLAEWNDTAGEASGGRRIHDLFEAQVARGPEAVAVAWDEGAWTYAELNRRASQLAWHLAGLGVGAGDLVAVHMGRSPEMVVAVLGVLKAGAGYVPVEVAWPAARVGWILGRLGVRCVLTETSRLEALAGIAETAVALVEAVCLEAGSASGRRGRLRVWGRDGLDILPVEGLRVRSLPEALAYIIFTSGSTGTPKGVAVRHAPVVNLIDWVNSSFGVGPTDRLLFVTALSFDLSVYDIFGILAAGGSVWVASEEEVGEPQRLVERLCGSGITFWDSAPAALQQLAAFLPGEPLPGGESLRLVFLSGDWVPLSLPERMRGAFPQAWVIALGGATEATVWSNFFPVEEVAPEWVSVPYGRPIRNARYHVLDRELWPMPIGVAGDLYIAGDCLASGYWSEPELTARQFVPDPFTEVSGGVMYRTGDRARYLRDGNLEFLGRRDQQVKVRGFRIELGEIEAVLGEHPGVREVVAVVREDRPGDRRVVAYVVGRSAALLSVRELREHAASRLPEPMVPSAIVELAAIPLTPNGKVDRSALPAPAEQERTSCSAAPRNPVEEVLAGLWADVLGVSQVGVHDDFFALGGHSLLATRLVARARETFGVDLSVRALLESPTLADMAVALTAARAGGAAALPRITPVGREADLPLSFAQQRLWFFQQVEPEQFAYHLPAAVRLHGPLDREALERSLGEIVRRHEVLRTCFPRCEGEPRQSILAAVPFHLPMVELAGEGPEGAGQLSRRILEEARRPFDLESGPVLRTLLFRLGPDEHVLLLVLHHIAADGWSADVFLRELGVLYGAFAQGSSSPLPELPVQYADYACWQREWLHREALERQLDYWKRQLGGAPSVLELPSDRPRPPVQAYRGGRCELALEPAVVERLRALARSRQVSLFMALLAAFQTLLQRYTGQADLSVGSPFANRDRSEVEPLIGFFINTLVLRTDLSGEPSWLELLDRVRRVVLGAHEHQDLPFELLVDELRPERSLSHNPLFQVLLNLQDPPSVPEMPGLSAVSEAVAIGATKFDLTLTVGSLGEGLIAALDYQTEMFDRPTAVRWLSHFASLLESAVAQPEHPLSGLPMLADAEVWQLVGEWARDDLASVEGACIHELFEEWVWRTPDAVAAVFESQYLTYRELDERAERLALHLEDLGVGPESRVGLHIDPSLEMLVGLLAVLKAGGAYVPISAQFPRERQAFIFQDSAIRVLLTESWRAADLPDFAGAVICLDRDRTMEEGGRRRRSRRPCLAVNAAYVIYTSGSTGQPKGVVIEHRQIVEYVRGVRERLVFTPGLRCALAQPISFDASKTLLFGSLSGGGCLHLISTQRATDAEALAEYFEHHEIETLKILPSHLAALHGAGDPRRLMPLRWLLLGGEGSRSDWVDRLRDIAPGCEIFNHYGPTETTVGVTTYHVAGPQARPEMPRIPIGRPLPNARCYVLDAWLHPVPVGVEGQLYVGGSYLARGYLGRPELTAQAFIPDPLASAQGGRLYRTGDRVRRLPDGALEFLGRRDHQLKIRGFRVEPGEIEAALSQHPAVREVVVTAWNESSESRRLIAYLVPAPGWQAEASELRSFLKDKVPDFMVPAAFVMLDALPRLNNLKLNLHALPAPVFGSAERDAAPPADPVQQQLAKIWEEVLGLERVGIHDNFFELGGDSILSIQIISRAARLGLRLSPKQLFLHQTIAELASVAGGDPLPEAEQGTLAGPVPLTPIQHWFFAQDLAEPHHFNQSVLLEVRPGLAAAVLGRGLESLVAHHDALRHRFEEREDGWAQAGVAAETASIFGVLDLTALAAGAEEAMRRSAEALQAGFDLARGPLIRAILLLPPGGAPARLLIAIHHLVVDGVSWRILVEDLATACEQLERGEPVALPRKTASFREWSEAMVRRARSGALAPELSHWLAEDRAQLRPLPLDFIRGENTAGSMRRVVVSLSAGETEALLREVPAVHKTQIDEVLLAALARALGLWSGHDLLQTDLEGHGREEIFDSLSVARTVGWFTTVFPVLVDLGAGTGMAEVLRAVKQEMRRIPNRGIGYGMARFLQQDESLAARLDRRSEVKLNYLGQLDVVLPVSAPFQMAPEALEASRSLRGRRSHRFDVVACITGGCFRLEWLYSASLHDTATIEALAGELLAGLRDLLDCRVPPEADEVFSQTPLTLLSQDELQGLLDELEFETEP
jgi:amino acid adenylation domain-containing protein/non-ribosomal peptide synthase protein (TIGR01720 family)